VVGYAAVAFFEAGKLGAVEREFLLRLARTTIERATAGLAPLPPAPAEIPPACRERRAAFVTLRKGGKLRGCIGNLIPTQPLHADVLENARAAAQRDSRFPPVTPAEMPGLHLEISVLTEPRPLTFGSPAELLAGLRPHQHGVLLQIGARRATFLPQVWEQLPDPGQFLRELARKAGCGPEDWRGTEVKVWTYEVEAFEEPPPGA
jgi:AmmeMemoRadiSam system protein A